MNTTFPHLLMALRKERGISQKQAAGDFGISQALLSHYEKGIRECGLDFVVKAADYYDVSCDYLLGRTPDKSGALLFANEAAKSSPVGRKMLLDSLSLLLNTLEQAGHPAVTSCAGRYLALSLYTVFRLLYTANRKNPPMDSSVPDYLLIPAAGGEMQCIAAEMAQLCSGGTADGREGLTAAQAPLLTPERLMRDFPLFAASMRDLLQQAEDILNHVE